ncbi:efflux RND transporter periplasmic adaptor subunit [Marinobacter adhaerens]|jgi:membrane fusion protein (multidrug efflux system)|uniref:Efflux RND transporter periplasmic adaptor subunit n=2 Tax=Marinobacter adhaerens TaxID=1033846 RepID=A0ABX8IPJ0_9GAMM|nr:efflux RND transporter periplasmic adaptor subunit [Marinobacter adhaerens]ADP96696.1 efflux transporter, RND family, MFP subunit [Marinobacter adhaerens HP15]MBW4979316.1 efflux RND transporter periplasmic adaptor subunit [Marinobacter adhaerens]QWV14666.1 efflux RND transporter periplasmic adaptor subunit [Marinobacter adhaerens]
MEGYKNFRIAVVSVCAGLLLAGCSEPQEPKQTSPVAVSVVVLEASEIRPSREFVARTAASAKADITPRIEAEIREILFTEGAKVSQGELLIRLEDTRASADLQQADAELAAARAEVDSASRNLKRGEEVSEKGFLSAADLDKLKDRFSAAESRLQAAQAAVQKAGSNLEYAEIRAPFDGWIGRLNYDVGAVVSPSSGAITSIQVTDPVYVEFQINEADFINFRRRGAESAQALSRSLGLYLTLPDGERYEQAGVLDFADVQTDASTGTVAMRAVFPNPDAVLVPGLYVTLRVEGQSGEPQVLVPQVAVQETIEGKFVLVVDDQNQVAQHFIQTGSREGALLVVNSGLEAGDRVIVEGLQKVRPGVTVSPVEKQIDQQTGALIQMGGAGQ